MTSATVLDVNGQPTGVAYQFAWDGEGRMVAQTGTGVPARIHVYDGDLLLGEVDGAGAPVAAYTWGADGLVSERLLSGTPKSLWYCFGPQGETRQLTDSTGLVADKYAYTAYGVAGPWTGSDPNPFLYGGQFGYMTWQLGGVSLQLCGARWYSPLLGRWLSRDPIGYDGGPNLYEYCDSDPVGQLDADGSFPGPGYIGGGFRYLRRKVTRAASDPDIAAEIAIAKYYRARGAQVRFVPEGRGRTSDLIVDGRRVDVRRITTPNKKGVLAKVLDKETQAEIIVLDIRAVEHAGLNAKNLCRIGAEARKVSSKIKAVKVLGSDALGRANVNLAIAETYLEDDPKSGWDEFRSAAKILGIMTGYYREPDPGLWDLAARVAKRFVK